MKLAALQCNQMYRAVVFLAACLLRADPPQPIFATYLGGGGGEVLGSVATDSQGNIYIAGRTDSSDFPVKNAVQPVSKAFSQIFIAKFSPAGDLLYSTYYGGSANDLANGIAVDPMGNVYLTGALQSHDFSAASAFQSSSGGAVDAFVLKLDPSGNVLYATYLGGKFNDVGMAIATDALGNAYVTGRTESPDFPITPGAVQPTPAGYRPGYSFISAFVTKLDPAGNLVYSTFLGGSGSNVAWSIAVDAYGQAHVSGETTSLDFPATANALQSYPGRQITLGLVATDAFLSKLSADGSSLVYSTLLGGPLQDSARSVIVDSQGNAYITGLTTDARLPILNGAQRHLGGEVYLTSTDGGLTFTARRSGLAAFQVTSIVFDPNVQSLVYAGTTQGVFRILDGGNTWTRAGLDDWSILQIVLDPSHPGTIYAGTNFGGGLFRSADGGDTWIGLNAGFPGQSERAMFQAIAVDPSGSGTVYAVAGSGGVGSGYDQPLYRITDNGATWTLLGHGLPSTPLAVAVSPDSTLYAGTGRFQFFSFFGGGSPPIPGTVYKRVPDAWVDGGLNDDIHALAFQGNTLYAAGQSFYRSTHGGLTWTSSPLPGNLTASQIALDARNSSTIYVLQASAFGTNLLRSDDGGQSFNIVSKQPLTAIAVNPFDSSLHAGTTASADAYVAEFDPSGTLLYSTFIGTASAERGDGIALDSSGNIYIAGFRASGNLSVVSSGTTFVSRADTPGVSIDIGASTAVTVLDMPSRAIAIGPDGGIVVAMIATQPGLKVQNATQSNLKGASDVYLVKWMP